MNWSIRAGMMNERSYRVSAGFTGKIFRTAEEAEREGFTAPMDDEIARAQRLFEEYQAKVDTVGPDRVKEVSPKFWGDTSGRETGISMDG